MSPPFVITVQPRFALGQLVATPGALAAASHAHLNACLNRHACCDWGLVCPEDKAINDEAVIDGSRELSAYAIDPAKPAKKHGENCFWTITKADRSATTFLLPDEY